MPLTFVVKKKSTHNWKEFVAQLALTLVLMVQPGLAVPMDHWDVTGCQPVVSTFRFLDRGSGPLHCNLSFES